MKKSIVLGLLGIIFLNVPQAHAGQYLNKHLPKWLEMDLQLRHRYEWMSDFDFNKIKYFLCPDQS